MKQNLSLAIAFWIFFSISCQKENSDSHASNTLSDAILSSQTAAHTKLRELVEELAAKHSENTEEYYNLLMTNFLNSPGIEPFTDKNTETKAIDSLFLHILGDLFGNGSKLEGNNSQNTMQYRLKQLERLIAQIPHHFCPAKIDICPSPVDKDHPTLAETIQLDCFYLRELAEKLRLALSLDLAKTIGLAALSHELKNAIDTLQAEGKFFFPGGWPQHAVIYEIIKEEGNFFTFRIYNTGDGIQYHSSLQTGGLELTLPYYDIKHITEENLLNPTTLNAIIALKGDQSTPAMTAVDFYEYLVREFHGTVENKAPEEHYIEAQKSGTCSYYSLSAAFGHNLGDDHRAGWFEYAGQFKSLVDYVNSQNCILPQVKKTAFLADCPIQFSRLTRDEKARNLLRKSLQVFAEYTNRAHDKKIMSHPLLNLAHATISKIRNMLDNIDSYLARERVHNSSKAPISEYTPLSSNFTKIAFKDTLESGSLPDFSSENRDALDLNLTLWEPSASTLNSDLESYSAQIRQANDARKAFLDSRFALMNIARKIPLDDGFWQNYRNIHKDHLEKSVHEILKSLAILAIEQLRSIYSRSSSYPQFEDKKALSDILPMIKLQTIASYLVHTFSKDLKVSYPSLYSEPIGELLYGEESQSALEDPEWVEQVQMLRKYWHLYKTDEAFISLSPSQQLYDNRSYDYRNGFSRPKWGFKEAEMHTAGPEIKWATDWLASNEGQKRLSKILGELKIKDDQNSKDSLLNWQTLLKDLPASKGLYILSEEYRCYSCNVHKKSDDPIQRAVLPESFFSLREISYALTLLSFDLDIWVRRQEKELTYGKIVNWNDMSSDFFKPFVTYHAWATNDLHRMGYRGYGLDIHLLNSQFGFLPDNQFQNTQNTINSDPTEAALEEKTGLSPNAIAVKKDLNSTLSTEASREILVLSSEKKLQVQQTLNYFKARPNLLLRSNYRELLKKRLLEPALLEEEIQTSGTLAKSFVSTLIQFCRDNYTFYRKQDLFEPMVFFLQLNQLLKDRVSYLQTKHPLLNLPTDFLNSRAELIKLFADKSYNTMERSILARDLALTFKTQNHLTQEEAVTLVTASIFHNRNPLNENHASPGIPLNLRPGAHQEYEFLIKNILRSKKYELKGIYAAHKDSFLNAICAQFLAKEKITWQLETSHFPQFLGKTSENTPIFLDLLFGELRIGGEHTSLADDITNSASYKKIFGDHSVPDAQMTKPGVFSLKDRNNTQYLIFQKDNKSLVFQKFLDGQWYQYLEAPSIASRIDYKYLTNPNFTHWFATNDKKHIQIFDDKEAKPAYLINLAKPADESQEYTVESLVHLKNHSQLVDIYKQANPFSFLTAVEDLEFVGVWADASHYLSAELPRLNLSFKITKDSNTLQFISNEYPNCRIADNQHLPYLGDMNHYLVLDCKKSDGIVIFADQLPEANKNQEDSEDSEFSSQTHSPAGGDSLSTFIRPDRKKEGQKVGIFTYKVKAPRSPILANDSEGMAFLALTLAWKNRYEEAFALLKNLNFETKLGAFKPRLLRILFDLARLDQRNGDQDPRAQAVRLFSWLMIYDNLELFAENRAQLYRESNLDPKEKEVLSLFFPKKTDEYLKNDKEKDPQKMLEELYLDYLQNQNYRHQEWLKPEDELVVANRISNHKRVRQRIEELKKDIKNTLFIHPKKVWTHTLASVQEFIAGIGFETYSYKMRESIEGTILRAKLKENFLIHYKIAKNQASALEKQTWLNQYSGSSQNEDSISTIVRIFQLMQSNSDDRDYAIVLETVALFPAAFPDARELQEPFLNYKGGIKYNDTFLNKFRADYLTKTASLHNPLQIDYGNLPNPMSKTQVKDQNRIQKCLKSTNPNAFLSSVANVSECFSQHESSTVDAESARILKSLYSVQLKDTMAQNFFAELKVKFETYAKSEKNIEFSLQDGDYEKLLQVIKDIKREQEILSFDLQNRESLLSFAANPPIKNKVRNQKKNLAYIAQKAKPVELEELILLFLKGDADAYRERNPQWTLKKISEIQNGFFEYLLQVTRRQQIQNILREFSSVESSQRDKTIAPDKKAVILKQFVKALLAKRVYDPEKFKAYLVFEYYLGFLLREDQVKALAAFKDAPASTDAQGQLTELIMSFGKTSVLLPLLSYQSADGENLAIIVMPESLLPEMSARLQKALGQSFSQKIEVMEFNRNTTFQVENLQTLYLRLNNIRKQKNILMISNSSIQSLYLSFIAKIRQYSLAEKKDDEGTLSLLRDEIPAFQKVFALFRKHGSVLIDEVDSVLDVLKSHHFSVGGEKPLDDANLDAFVDFYRIYYRIQNVKDLALEKLKEQVLAELVKLDFFKKFNARELRSVLAYLKKEQAPGMGEWLASLSTGDRDYLAIFYEQFNSMLGLMNSKKYLVHFGPPAEPPASETDELARWRKKRSLAIPYHNGRPEEKSQFGTEFEVLNYTIRMNMEQRLEADLLQAELKSLQERYLSALQKNNAATQKGLLKHFQELFKGRDNAKVLRLNAEDYEAIADNIEKEPTLKLAIIRKFVLPLVSVYPVQLNSNSELYGALFKKVQGFSGTLWNYRNFPLIFKDPTPSDTEERTISLLLKDLKTYPSLKNVNVISQDLLELSEPKALVKNLLESSQLHADSIIDMGGMFRNFSSEKVAAAMLDFVKKKGVVFYKGDLEYVMERADPKSSELKISLLKERGLAPEDRAVYWDQSHTTGSDITVAFDITAVLTVGKHNLMRDLLQSVWRLRGFEGRQSVEFALADEDRNFILKQLKFWTDIRYADISFESVLLFTQLNQITRLGELNYRSLKNKLKGRALRVLLDLYFGTSLSPEELAKSYDRYFSLFETRRAAHLYQMFGNFKIEGPKLQVVCEQSEKLICGAIGQGLQSDANFHERFSVAQLRSEIGSIVSKEATNLPDHIVELRSPRAGAFCATVRHFEDLPQIPCSESLEEAAETPEMENEVQVEVAQEVENHEEHEEEQEQEFTAEVAPSGPAIAKNPLPWPEAHIFEKSYYQVKPAADIKDKAFPAAQAPLLALGDMLETYQFKEGKAFSRDLIISLNLAPMHLQKFGWIIEKLEARIKEAKEQTGKTYTELLAEKNLPPSTTLIELFDYAAEKYPDLNMKELRTEKSYDFVPFAYEQIPIHQALFVGDKTSQRAKLILLQPSEAEFFQEQLAKHNKARTSNDLALALVHLEGGVYRQSEEIRFSEYSNYLQLFSQAKFYAGKVDYSKEESAYLKTWLQQEPSLGAFFKTYVLAWKSMTRELFKDSAFEHLLDSSAVSPAKN